MKYYSLNNNSKNVSFLNAVKNGLAADRGLYFPKKIPLLSKDLIKNIKSFSNHEIAFKAIEPYVGKDIPDERLKRIIEETLSFDFPIIPITNSISSLELFHGPTLAFKDVGARFMARCLAYANEIKETKELTVLVATSGDTGGAVADGFYDVEGIKVVILYPKGKVSPIQEKQLTTFGKNITALEINGTFDDCQDMVKSAFIDSEIKEKITLTSANSINIARWLAQMFYFFIAFKERPNPDKKLAISVPSGNFGNLCAGLMAKQMGLPIDHFIASTNINNTVPKFLETGIYSAKKSQTTLSNAMDVGDPSNFIRIQEIFNNDLFKTKKSISGSYFNDSETIKGIKEVFKKNKYITDPHGAIGYLGLKSFLNLTREDFSGIFLGTAHPIKFAETVESTLKIKMDIPERLKSILELNKKSIQIENYNQLKSFLLDL